MVTFVKATEKDARALAELDSVAHKEMKVWTLQREKDFARSLRKKDFDFLLAFVGPRAVGYLETEFDAPKEIVWIKNIFVLRAFRQKNIARQMLQQSIRHWKRKTRLLVLLTADRNLKIFEKLGFKKTMNYLVQEI